MKTITIIWGTIVLLAISTFGQVSTIDTYGAKTSTNKKADIRFNVALQLVNGTWNRPQEAFLVKAVLHPSRDLEAESFLYFSPEELKMFGRSDQFDISLFRASFHLGSTQQRWAYIRGLTTAQKAQWWRIQIAYALTTESPSPEQVENLLDIAKTLTSTPDLTALSRLEGVASRVFGGDLGKKIFGLNIPGQPCGSVTSLAADCGCSNGSWFNSCSGCGAGNGCHVLDDGCGFLGFYICDGKCGVNDGEIQ